MHVSPPDGPVPGWLQQTADPFLEHTPSVTPLLLPPLLPPPLLLPPPPELLEEHATASARAGAPNTKAIIDFRMVVLSSETPLEP